MIHSSNLYAPVWHAEWALKVHYEVEECIKCPLPYLHALKWELPETFKKGISKSCSNCEVKMCIEILGIEDSVIREANSITRLRLRFHSKSPTFSSNSYVPIKFKFMIFKWPKPSKDQHIL